MAGEDPGVAIIGLVIDSARKVADIIASAAKSAISGIMDIIKTGTFLYFRMKMNRNQNPAADLKHGKQSLGSLRHHEALGAQLVTVEIGDDRHAKQILKSELKKTEVDFVISKHEGTYFLHYKKDNEQDVALAQAFALRRLHGEPEQTHEQQNNRERDNQPRAYARHRLRVRSDRTTAIETGTNTLSSVPMTPKCESPTGVISVDASGLTTRETASCQERSSRRRTPSKPKTRALSPRRPTAVHATQGSSPRKPPSTSS